MKHVKTIVWIYEAMPKTCPTHVQLMFINIAETWPTPDTCLTHIKNKYIQHARNLTKHVEHIPETCPTHVKTYTELI